MNDAQLAALRARSVAGPRLAALRLQARLSIAQMAQRAAVHPAALARWEKGAYALDAAVVGRLAAALKVEVESLLWPRDAHGQPVLDAVEHASRTNLPARAPVSPVALIG